ncbi:MAG TPA: SulP family inorganic anion transporter, partial [Caulobacteraceae bacterium]|nr:SulP family inorganic anion transporter [Caulobacteraceae bacterium]
MAAGSASEWPRPRAVALLSSLRGYQSASIAPDILAGLTLAAIAIPEQMATARLGGFPPQVGFFAFIAASTAFALMGASRQLSAGADSTITPIFAGGLALLAATGSPHYAALACVLAIMVGSLVAGAGLLRMGWIGNLLSGPVTLGFLAG